MQIKISNLYAHIGQIVELKDLGEHIPNGIYIILSKEEYGIEVGNLLTREFIVIEDYDEETEVRLIDYTVNLQELINFKLANIVNLLAEGWRINNEEFCNLSPQITEYRTLLLLKKLEM
jgi:hypothetical protein